MPEASLDRLVRVVVVDDSDDVRLLLRVVLQRDGRFDVVGEAADGREAIECVTATQPDLVVLDRQMPRLGGIEALPEIRDAAPGASVILYTAHPDDRLHDEARAAGAAGVLTKNVVGEEFVDQLTSLLRSESGEADGASVWPSSSSRATT